MGVDIQNILWATAAMISSSVVSFSAEIPAVIVAAREDILTKEQRDTRGLKWFIDGNGGVLIRGNEVRLYGANGREPVRVTGTRENPFQRLDRVFIATDNKDFHYLAGGPIFRDPKSNRIFLFYHAEIHRGTYKNFYSVLGLAIQTDEQGLKFKDLGPIFTANVSGEQAKGIIEVCGAPYIIKDGYFYVYARDAMADGNPRESNLSVARAQMAEVIRAGLDGKSDLFITCSEDGIHWADRRKLAIENGEAFYPSIIGFLDDPRVTEKEFYVYYTFSTKGAWERWDDAAIVRRKITFADRPD